jgi:RNA polymerase primary sigma factor
MNEYKGQETILLDRYRAGDAGAKVLLLKSLDPLINSQVAKFHGSGLPREALWLEGKALASQAIDTYDASKGTQLNTHTVNYLKKLSRFTTNYQNVGHIPEPRALMIGTYNTVRANLEAEKGRQPTAEEIADAMQVPLIEIDRLQTELRKDLSTNVVDDDDDGSGFYEYSAPMEYDPKIKQAIEFTYFDSDAIDKKILEYTLGLHGTQRKKVKDIALLLNIPDNDLKARKTILAKKIKELL